jgi:hypothetical protein
MSTWVLDEVQLAIQKVYKVLVIMEVYENEVTKYDRHKREGGPFADHINTFLKLKAEASGYPSWVRNPEEEERYVNNFYAIECVGWIGGLAKLCLNSL